MNRKTNCLALRAVAVTLLVSLLFGCGQDPTASTATRVLSAEAQGYGGLITAEVTLKGDKITDLVLTGEDETPTVGGEALKLLAAAIVQKGSLNGVDAVAGATQTSDGVFAAVRAALSAQEV